MAGSLVSHNVAGCSYFMQCGNNIVQPKDPDEATAEILYTFYNRRSCTDEPFSSRINRVVVDTMAAKKKTIGVDPVPPIRMVNFLAPRGIDLSHFNYIIMDGLYYSFLYIKADGYPSRVRAGWMSALINAGEGVDIDVHLRRENRSKTIDKVAQRIRLNRTKLRSMQDTSTDYEELANSIQAGYYIKSGIANNNEDLFYMSVFTVQDCMGIVLEKVTEKVQALSKCAESKQSSGQSYTYVETDFVKALKHGYLVEIQEPSTIMQPGVLVGLNSLLEQEGSITLPTGEIIHRHPDTVVVVTTNVSYEGCRQMNQSVVDRMSLVKDIELPESEVMVQRAMAVTGCTDEYQVSQMVQVVNDMADYCRKNSITDGACGMRSLIDWIISSEISGDPYLSAKYTIISKATANEEDREALITTILDPLFAPKRARTSA